MKIRRTAPVGGDLLLCVHGLGCAKECFDTAFEAGWLARPQLSIAAFDLPGHGGSGPLPAAGDAIQAYAELTVDLIRQLSPSRLFLLCHSMGCAVGLVATQDLGRIDGFVSVEGNLLPQDCGLISRRSARLPRAEFVECEYPRLRAELAASPRPDLRAWGGWYAQADPVALHRVARSLVEWSDSGKLLGLLTDQPAATYIYGRDSGDLDHLLPSLGGVAAYPIAGSGHFPMIDNPADFWRTVAHALDRPVQ